MERCTYLLNNVILLLMYIFITKSCNSKTSHTDISVHCFIHNMYGIQYVCKLCALHRQIKIFI